MKFLVGGKIVKIKADNGKVNEIEINGKKLSINNSIEEFVEFMMEVEGILKVTNPELKARLI